MLLDITPAIYQVYRALALLSVHNPQKLKPLQQQSLEHLELSYYFLLTIVPNAAKSYPPYQVTVPTNSCGGVSRVRLPSGEIILVAKSSVAICKPIDQPM